MRNEETYHCRVDRAMLELVAAHARVRSQRRSTHIPSALSCSFCISTSSPSTLISIHIIYYMYKYTSARTTHTLALRIADTIRLFRSYFCLFL